MKLERFLTLACMAALILFACKAQGRDVRVIWDPPTPQDAVSLEGYNVYEVTFDPPVAPPKPAAEANIPSPVSGSVKTERKLNTEPIPAGTLEFVIKDARPGMQTIVRAFNFMGESPDSDVLTLHDVPKKPEGVKAVAVLIEQSSNLKDWSPLAVVYAAADLTASFFRLDIK
jgi:hypothetical protein